MDLISVIIPVYNVEKYIDRCLRTVINQTYKNLEIILIDDGSTDNSGKICDKYKKMDNRIKVIHKANSGVSSARNAGLDIAKGDYIVFVDPDDWIPQNSLQYLYDLRNKYNADFAIASHIRTFNFQNMVQNNYGEYELTQQDFLTKFFKIGTQENVQYPWAKLYNKKLFEIIRYPVGVACGEDVLTTFQIALRSSKIAYSTNIVYFYYINENSVTASAFNEQKFDLVKVWDLVCIDALQFGESWILSNALINRKRADFGILMELAISNIALSEKHKYLSKVTNNISDLRNNMLELCKAAIPLSRKIFIVCFSINYPVCLYALHWILILRRMITKKRRLKI